MATNTLPSLLIIPVRIVKLNAGTKLPQLRMQLASFLIKEMQASGCNLCMWQYYAKFGYVFGS
jgi:hypothetical protein